MIRAGMITFITALLLCSCHHSSRQENRIEYGDTLMTRRLVIEEERLFTRVTIKDPWQNSGGVWQEWYLVPHDSVIPAGVSEAQVIRVPVSRMICMSATHIAMLRTLGADSLLAGISGPALLYDSLVLEGIRSGEIVDVGYEENLNRELIISLKPDLLMTYGITAPFSGVAARLTDAGVKVMYNAEYLEEYPLARAAWIRLFGLLTGKGEMADSVINRVTGNYLEMVSLVKASVTVRPRILLGAPWEDVWYISPSNTYTGHLIKDAGGDYLFSDMAGSNSVPLSVESVFRRALDADLWINPGSARSLAEITAADHRLASLPLLREGEVWNNQKRITGKGGNDYWESGVMRPDLVLADLISIFHPELLPGREQYYYLKLE